MVTCASAFTAGKPIDRVRKWEVLKVADLDEQTPPALLVVVQMYGQNEAPWPLQHTLYFRDSVPSLVLTINATPTSLLDQFLIQEQTLAGTPYSTLANAYNGNTTEGTKSGRRKTVESLLVSVGGIPSQLAP